MHHRWTADHAQLFERLEMVWEQYDLLLDGQVDGSLTRGQVDKLIDDLRMQIDDSVVHQDMGDEAPLVIFDQRNNIQVMDSTEGDNLAEDSACASPGRLGPERSRAAARQSIRRGSVKGGGGRGSVKDVRAGQQVVLLEARVASLETQLEVQDAAFCHVAEALATLGAALNVSLPPVPPAPSRRKSPAGGVALGPFPSEAAVQIEQRVQERSSSG